LNYLDFCKAAELMKVKAHITTPGVDKILALKSKMNLNRENTPSIGE
jgi:hypothetical protein